MVSVVKSGNQHLKNSELARTDTNQTARVHTGLVVSSLLKNSVNKPHTLIISTSTPSKSASIPATRVALR